MKRIGLPVVLAVSLIGLVGRGGHRVSADPWASCNMGTQVANGVGLSVDGVTLSPGSRNSFGDYTLVVCRDTNNSAYLVNVGRTGGGGGSARELTTEDAAKSFTITFTPDAGDIPLLVEGHGLTNSFSVDATNANAVAIVVQPLAYSDIYGNDCGNKGPIECAKAVTKASHDSVAAIWFSVRFQDPTGKGSEYSLMPGMTWSSSAYDFWPRYSCPAQNPSSLGGIELEIAGPHLKADGVTPNVGFARVFIPTVAVANCWGALPADVLAQLKVTRTENGTTQNATTGTSTDTGLQYTAEATVDGLVITFPAITFSVPKYLMKTRSGKALMRSKTTVSSLARALKVAAPNGGRLVVAVGASSKKVCVAGTSAVYGRKPGTCTYSVTAFRRNGKKLKTAKGSFRVR